MKNPKIIIVVILLAIAILAYGFYAQKTEKASKEAKYSLEQKIDSQGSVSVSITPQKIEGDLWEFEVVLDTHAEELDEDLTKVTVIVDDEGREYKPVSWKGSPPGGHHRSGVLSFNPIKPMPEQITLKMNIAESQRMFSWKLGGE